MCISSSIKVHPVFHALTFLSFRKLCPLVPLYIFAHQQNWDFRRDEKKMETPGTVRDVCIWEIGIIPQRESIPHRNYCVASVQFFTETHTHRLYTGQAHVFPRNPSVRNNHVRANFLTVEPASVLRKKLTSDHRLHVFLYATLLL